MKFLRRSIVATEASNARRLLLASTLIATCLVAIIVKQERAAAASAPSAQVEGINGWGDDLGFHVVATDSSTRPAWRQVVTLRPQGIDASSWSGNTCLTPDGRYAAAVVYPTFSVNSAQAQGSGAYAYGINLATGHADFLGAANDAYFDPGCGSSDLVAITRSEGPEWQTSVVTTWNLATTTVESNWAGPGQMTSATPTRLGTIAALGSSIVNLRAQQPQVLATVHGQPYDLVPHGGGFAFLSMDGASRVTLHDFQDGRDRAIVTSATRTARLFASSDGRPSLYGMGSHDSFRTLAPTSTFVPLDAFRSGTGTFSNVTPSNQIATSSVHAPLTTVLAPRAPVSTVTSTLVVRSALRHARLSNRDATANLGSPCAVSRLDPHVQVPQNSAAQADWAIAGLLNGTLKNFSRPKGFRNMVIPGTSTPLPSYSPLKDFPLQPLTIPFGVKSSGVPQSIVEGVLATESNFDQASWHAVPGESGDPLIANYYGLSDPNSLTSFDPNQADCGYGIAQITTGMHTSDLTPNNTNSFKITPNEQVAVAVDEVENIAAAIELLSQKWNDLMSYKTYANTGDPRYLENWYLALWAYNTGWHAQGTGKGDSWGLGWLNDPANPQYPRFRGPFLGANCQSLDDARHPSLWPYQERVLGWAACPLWTYSGQTSVNDYPAAKVPSTGLNLPAANFFCPGFGNQCTPTSGSTTCDTANPDGNCWWHGHAQWTACLGTTCSVSSSYSNVSSSEPTVNDPFPATCELQIADVSPPSATGKPIIVAVTGGSVPYNVVGCSQSPGWTNQGTFTMSPGRDANGNATGLIDLHQLGAGFGGRVLFTHGEPASALSLVDVGVWKPNLPANPQYYDVRVHLPTTGAQVTDATYILSPSAQSDPSSNQLVQVNQNRGREGWVDLGAYGLSNGATLTLSNISSMAPATYDVAFDAVAFTPLGGQPTLNNQGVPIGGGTTVKVIPGGTNPADPNCSCSFHLFGDPVNTATGTLTESMTDLATSGHGLPLLLSRTYDSDVADPKGPNGSSAVNGPFGWGWFWSYGLNLKLATSCVDGFTGKTLPGATVQQEDGSQVCFEYQGSAGYTPSLPRDRATLVRQSNGNFVYTRLNQSVYTFNAKGQMIAETSFAGTVASPRFQTTFTYDSTGHLITITDPEQRSQTLTWTGSHVSKATDPAGRSVRYYYDTAGNLTQVDGVSAPSNGGTLGGDVTYYKYLHPETHLLTSLVSPTVGLGTQQLSPTTTNVYDNQDRVVQQLNPLGAVTTYSYSTPSSFSCPAALTLPTPPSLQQTTVTSSSGLISVDTYLMGMLVCETLHDPSSTQWRATSYTYDPFSLGVTSETESTPDYTNRTILRRTYDVSGNMLSQTDALGATTSFTYNAQSRLVSVETPDGLITTTAYDSPGSGALCLSTSSTCPTLGNVTRSTLNSYVSPGDNTQCQTSAQPGGSDAYSCVPTAIQGLTTTLRYDSKQWPTDLTSEQMPTGATVTKSYDLYGNVTSVTLCASLNTDCRENQASFDPTTNEKIATFDALNNETDYTYNAEGQTTSVTTPLAQSTMVYDASGHVITATDGLGRVTTTSYDALGDVTSVTAPSGSVTTKTYTKLGKVLSTTSATGLATTYGYDAFGHTVAVTRGGATTAYAFNADGDLLSRLVPSGKIIHYTYDADHRRLTVTYGTASQPAVTNSYDAIGNLVARHDQSGDQSWSYNAQGYLANETLGSGATIVYAYDQFGRLTTETYPNGLNVTYAFNALNEKTSVTDWLGQTTHFTYNPVGVLVNELTGGKGIITTAVDQLQNPTNVSVHDATGSLTFAMDSTRDALGRIATQATSEGSTSTLTSNSYTPDGQLASSASTLGSNQFHYDASGTLTSLASINLTYNPLNQELCWTAVTPSGTCGNAPAGATTYSYDADGNRTSSTSSSSAQTFGYDEENQLTDWRSGGHSLHYTYDGAGLVSSITGSETASLSYDATGHLLSDGHLAYVYGPDARPIEQLDANASDYVITGTTLTQNAGDAPAWLVHDQVGSTLALLTASGDVVGRYGYSPFGSVLTHTGVGSSVQYAGAYDDGVSGLLYMRHRFYDPSTATFTSVDPLSNLSADPYGYSANDPMNNADPTGSFCFSLGDIVAIGAVVLAVAIVAVTAVVAPELLGIEFQGAEELAAAASESESAISGAEAAASDAESSLTATAPAEGESVSAENCTWLKVAPKAEWTADQLADFNTKVDMLNALGSGVMAKTEVVRHGSASKLWSANGNDKPLNTDIDHVVELQLGGADDVSNMQPLDKSVNRSVGKQIANEMKGLNYGDPVCGLVVG